MARKRIYVKPAHHPDLRVWAQVSAGGMSMMNMDKRLYKGVQQKIIKEGKDREGKPYYSFWVKRRSFREHGHRWL